MPSGSTRIRPEYVPAISAPALFGAHPPKAVIDLRSPSEFAEDHVPGGPKLSSVGKPVLGSRISIQDESGKILPRGEIGEVCIQGGQLMRLYWKKEEAPHVREALRAWGRADLIGRHPGALVQPGPAFGAWSKRGQKGGIRYDTHMGMKVERATRAEESEENWEAIVRV